MSKRFEKWWENKGYFINKDNQNDAVQVSRETWSACKNETFSILNKLQTEPNTKVRLNDIFCLLKEEL